VIAVAMLAFGSAIAADWPDIQTPPARTGSAPQDAALIIAAEDYIFAPDIPGAGLNAQAWNRYLRETRGVGTVKVLAGTDATRENILDAAQGVGARVGSGGTIWVVYIGHGAPSKDGQDGLLVGIDAQQTANSIYARSVTQKELLDGLQGKHSQTVMVIDACFSGKSSGGVLVPGLQPMIPSYAVTPTSNVITMTAGKSDQFAGPLSDGSRPAFSYLVLGALRGWGDKDGDGKVTAHEAVDYASNAIFETVNGRTQVPQLLGEDIILGPAGVEAAPVFGTTQQPPSPSPTGPPANDDTPSSPTVPPVNNDTLPTIDADRQREIDTTLRNSIEVKKCFYTEYQATGALPARVDLRFTLESSGAVSDAAITQARFADSALNRCLSAAAEGIRFAPSSETRTLTFPFVLE